MYSSFIFQEFGSSQAVNERKQQLLPQARVALNTVMWLIFAEIVNELTVKMQKIKIKTHKSSSHLNTEGSADLV